MRFVGQKRAGRRTTAGEPRFVGRVLCFQAESGRHPPIKLYQKDHGRSHWLSITNPVEKITRIDPGKIEVYKKRKIKLSDVFDLGCRNSVPARYFYMSALILAGVLMADVIGAKLLGFDISMSNLSGGVIGLSVPAGLFFLIGRIRRYSAVCRKIYLHRWLPGLLCLIYFIVFSSAVLVLQSLAVALDAPLVDDMLIRTDALLGFHWLNWAAWYAKHPLIKQASYYLYTLWLPQIFFSIFVLSFAGRIEDLFEFIVLFCCAVVLSIVVGGIFPASDPFLHFGMGGWHGNSPWSQFYLLRDGGLRSMDFKDQQGLVSFPSMHAVAAVLFVHSLRNIRYLFGVSMAVNFFMTVSAIYCGAHYFVDIASGLGLSLALIFLSHTFKESQRPARSGWGLAGTESLSA